MAAEQLTPTIEDYLGVIYTLERDGENVIGARLADLLDVSAPTVTATLKRMIRDGWISFVDGKNIELTEKGLNAAKKILSKHMLSEWLLADVLDVSWSNTHEQAHMMEHSISDELIEKMRKRLNEPEVCPHGNPLPGHEDVIRDWQKLTEVSNGRRIIIRRIHEHAEDNRELLRYLEDNHILPGVEAVVESVLDFNQTITLKIGEESIALGTPIAKYIYAEVLD